MLLPVILLLLSKGSLYSLLIILKDSQLLREVPSLRCKTHIKVLFIKNPYFYNIIWEKPMTVISPFTIQYETTLKMSKSQYWQTTSHHLHQHNSMLTSDSEALILYHSFCSLNFLLHIEQNITSFTSCLKLLYKHGSK